MKVFKFSSRVLIDEQPPLFSFALLLSHSLPFTHTRKARESLIHSFYYRTALPTCVLLFGTIHVPPTHFRTAAVPRTKRVLTVGILFTQSVRRTCRHFEILEGIASSCVAASPLDAIALRTVCLLRATTGHVITASALHQHSGLLLLVVL